MIAESTEMGEEVEKRIRGEIEEGVLVEGKIRIIGVRKGEFWSIATSSTHTPESDLEKKGQTRAGFGASDVDQS